MHGSSFPSFFNVNLSVCVLVSMCVIDMDPVEYGWLTVVYLTRQKNKNKPVPLTLTLLIREKGLAQC